MDKCDNLVDLLVGDDRELVLLFFVTFSRFEYALKQAGFLENRKYASPDWGSFANGIEAKLASVQDTEFTKAKAYLLQHPPKKQIVRMPRKKLDWEDEAKALIDEQNGANYLLRLVKSVRNNLFHGGKYPYKPVSGRELRNRELLQACLTVLVTCLSLDDSVKSYFEDLHEA